MNMNNETGLLPESGMQWRRKMYTRQNWGWLLRLKWSRVQDLGFGKYALKNEERAIKAIHRALVTHLEESDVIGTPELEVHVDFMTNVPCLAAYAPIYRNVNPEHRELVRIRMGIHPSYTTIEVVEKVEP